MTTATATHDPHDQLFGHPKGLYVCFFTEMWERFSFYGMKALLFLYLTKYHLFGDAPSYDLLGAYGGLVYAVPVIGGMIADRYLGMRKAVILGGILLVLGHAGMAVEGHAARNLGDGVIDRDDAALQVFYLSLALIIMGVGFLKPNISTIVGRLYPANDPRRDSGFTIFYAGINLGALLASLICGYLGETYGWKYGFGAAGIGMLFGLVVFISGQKFLHGHAEPSHPERLVQPVLGPLKREPAIYLGALGGVAVMWLLIQRTAIVHNAMHFVAVGFLAWFVYFLIRLTQVQRQQMLVLLYLILGNLIFFALYEQTYGSWVAFTDRLLTKNLLGFEMTAGSLTFIGALFIVAFSPLFAWLWPFLDKRGLNPSTPLKAAIGLAFGGLAFIPLVLAAGRIGGPELASVWWLVLAYLVLEVGEMCLSPIGLSAVTKLSVASVVGLMMGGWFLATAYSEVIAAMFGKLTSIEMVEGKAFDYVGAANTYSGVFMLMLWIGLGSAVVFLALSPLMRKWMHGIK